VYLIIDVLCRYCGLIFCAICSNYTCELPDEYEYTGAQRVCLDCYQTLNQLLPEKQKKLNNMRFSFNFANKIDSASPTQSHKEGYMVKKGHRRRNWNRRFFILKNGILYYFDADPETARKQLEKEVYSGTKSLLKFWIQFLLIALG
jgi:hypothetical protein